MSETMPPPIAPDLRRARRLAWWTLFWMGTIVVVMALVMGSSQAMKSAWIEDVLGIVPSVTFLVALHFEFKEPTKRYGFGFDRVQSLGFLIAAVALAMVGAFLLVDSAMTLIEGTHTTIGSVTLLGHQFWMGWLMIAALLYSVIPPLILGRIKLPIARRTSDQVLHTDAMMQKADWMTGLAGVLGVVGLGLGFWWADAAAAGAIAFSIVHDGYTAVRISAAEIMDSVPRKLGEPRISSEAAALRDALQDRWPAADVRLRESGRYIFAQVAGVTAPPGEARLAEIWPGDPARLWRFAQLSFVPAQPGAP